MKIFLKKKMIKIFLFIITFYFLSSCGSMKEGLSLKKKSDNSDEFLIEKKSPLVLPPNFNELPTPGTSLEKKTMSSNEIQQLLEKNDTKKNSSQSVGNIKIEENILEKIKNR